jgi:hypothetical protein
LSLPTSPFPGRWPFLGPLRLNPRAFRGPLTVREVLPCLPHRSASCPTGPAVVRSRRRISRLPAWLSPGASYRVVQRSPLRRLPARCPLPRAVASSLRPAGATLRARAVLVVSHHLDGFLHLTVCELVASRFRPWGSSGFRQRVAARCASPPMLLPSRAFPSRAAVQRVTACHGPLAVTGCSRLDLKALFRSKVRCIRLPLPACFCPMLSWASLSGATHPLSPVPRRLAPSCLRR